MAKLPLNDIGWSHAAELPSKEYSCGHCNARLASAKGSWTNRAQPGPIARRGCEVGPGLMSVGASVIKCW